MFLLIGDSGFGDIFGIAGFLAFIPFQDGIGVERLLDVFTKFYAVELQQTDGLLQLWRHSERLTEF